MEIGWLNLIGASIALVGLILVFDARRITKKNFPTSEENSVTLGIKILGALVIIVGGVLAIIS